jgi:hypothetical protein
MYLLVEENIGKNSSKYKKKQDFFLRKKKKYSSTGNSTKIWQIGLCG